MAAKTSKTPTAPSKKKDKYIKHKMALVPVLLGVLLYVLFAGSDDDPPEQAAATAAPQTPSTTATATMQTGHTNLPVPPMVALSKWPEANLAFLDGPNPFRSYWEVQPETTVEAEIVQASPEPEVVREPVSQQLQRSFEEQPIEYVFQSGTRKLVMFGKQLFQPGDTIFENVRIHDIERGRLVFAVDEAPDSAEQVQ